MARSVHRRRTEALRLLTNHNKTNLGMKKTNYPCGFPWFGVFYFNELFPVVRSPNSAAGRVELGADSFWGFGPIWSENQATFNFPFRGVTIESSFSCRTTKRTT